MENILNKFNSIKGASFIGLRGYKNASGEVSDITLNIGVSYQKQLQKDLDKLNTITDETLVILSNESNLPIETLTQAIVDLIDSTNKNLSKDLAEHTASSITQIDTYMNITTGVKLHKTSMEVFINGFLEKKKVIQAGVYKEVKSKPLTIAKNLITKFLDLNTAKVRMYKFNNIDSIKISGTEIFLQ